MTRPRQHGLVLLYVLLLIILAGVGAVWMAQAADNMVRESNRMYAESCARNLLASGQAWADRRARSGWPPLPPGGKTIDLQAMEAPQGSLTIAPLSPPVAASRPAVATTSPVGATTQPAVLIQAACKKGRYSVHREALHTPG